MKTTLFGYAGHTAVKRALEAIFVDSLTQLLGGQENVLQALSAHDDAVSRGDAAAPEIFRWQEAVDQASDAAFSQLRRPDHAHFEVEE